MACKRLTIQEFLNLPPESVGYETEELCRGPCSNCAGTATRGVLCPSEPNAYQEYMRWVHNCDLGTWNSFEAYRNCFVSTASPPDSCGGFTGTTCSEQGVFPGVTRNLCCSWTWSNGRFFKISSDIVITTAWNGNSFSCDSVQLTTPYVIPKEYWIYQFFNGPWHKGMFHPDGVSVFELDPMLNWLAYGCQNPSSYTQFYRTYWGGVVDGQYVQTTAIPKNTRTYFAPAGCDITTSEFANPC